ncbi:hypothetical protein HYDPIDRAFT_31175 [Hydnomerulius pinastri MD-312]|uniref:F-box domain-containing protein n=1 Tax=Hydnomerulius pinastri MD-312 TaxID=994086 RepID=A0A0C9W4W2_9AGAM|nr:hypothetical protein HYDPIDRAFT_31175 [Hydnomerulius pinastri MD-312]
MDGDAKQQGVSHILRLAEELLCHILSFLSFRDIVICASSCRTLRAALDGSTELQYVVELGVNGLSPVVGSHPHLSTSEKLQLLRRAASQWNSAEFIPTTTICPLPDGDPEDEMTGGCMHFSEQPYRGEVIDLRAYKPDPAEQPPSSIRRWSCEDFAQNPSDSVRLIRIDASQDLMVVAAMLGTRFEEDQYLFRLDLFSMSTNEWHPLAGRRPLFSHRATRAGGWAAGRTLVRIHGPFVAFYACPFSDDGLDAWSIQVWNWRERIISDNCVVGDGHFGFTGPHDFDFLDSERLLVYSFTCESAYLSVYSFSDLSKPLEFRTRYAVPIQYPWSSIVNFSSNHVPSQQTCHAHKRSLWVPTLEDRVVALVAGGSFSLIISIRALLHPPTYWKEVRTDGISAIPWETWGPSNARCICQSDIRCISGYRVVLDTRHHGNMVLDFNLCRIRRSGSKIVSNDTISQVSSLSQELTTSLPYAQVKNLPTSELVASMHMDEEMLVVKRFAGATPSFASSLGDEHVVF